MEELDTSVVIDWGGRSRRERKGPAKTYWEEYVETDPWYRKEMVKDVPAEEMWAALEDSDLDEDSGEESDDDDSDDEMEVDDGFIELGEESTSSQDADVEDDDSVERVQISDVGYQASAQRCFGPEEEPL